MSAHSHAIVWIDHRQARVLQFNLTEEDERVLRPKDAPTHIHHHASSIGASHAVEDQKFLHQVAVSLEGVTAALITGPASAKFELVKHIEKHDPQLAKIIAGVEALDHPTDGELVAHARQFFRAADRMTPQR